MIITGQFFRRMSSNGRRRHAIIRGQNVAKKKNGENNNLIETQDGPITSGNVFNLGRAGGNAEDATRRLENKKKATTQVAAIFAKNPTDVVGLKWKLNHLLRLDSKERYDVSDSILMGLEVMRGIRENNRAILIKMAKEYTARQIGKGSKKK